jgi:hypothetical protein
MPKLRRITVAMLTRNIEDAGTDELIALSINDKQITYFDTSQEDQERGKANLYETNVEQNDITTEELNNSAIRLLILGSNQWSPEQFVVWAETVDGTIFPLAIESNITQRLSTNPERGNALLPLRTVGQGVGATFTRLLFMMTTADGAGNGTDNKVNLTVRNSDGVPVVNFDIVDTPQDEQESGEASAGCLCRRPFSPIRARRERTVTLRDSLRRTLSGLASQLEQLPGGRPARAD